MTKRKPKKASRRRELMRLDDLLASHHPDNPKDHDIPSIVDSIRRFGFIRPVVMNETDGKLLLGHGSTEALEVMRVEGNDVPSGIEVTVNIEYGRTTPAWLVPTERGVRMSRREAKAYRLADNYLSEKGGWDEPKRLKNLLDLSKRPRELRGTGFDEDDVSRLSRLFGDLKPVKADKMTAEADKIEKYLAKWKPELGDYWLIGEHRLVVGDFMTEALEALMGPAVADLVLVDPPYAIYGSSTGVDVDVADDKMVRPFFKEVLKAARRIVKEFGHVYVFSDWRSWPSWWDVSKDAALSPSNLIVWDKGDFGLGSTYRNCHELIGFFQSLPGKTSHLQSRRAGVRLVMKPNILRYERTGQGDDSYEKDSEPGERYFSAVKPVNLCRELIVNSTDPGELIVDYLIGTGTTMIAADIAGRICYGMDISPKYAAVVLERMSKRGYKPKRRKS